MEALFYEQAESGIKCLLCPHLCVIKEGRTGICKVRRNAGGRLIAETWGNISAMHIDPVEKKPLYHFFPGTSILSIGSVGCNMHCRCCQNWQISQVSASEYQFDRQLEPHEIVTMALSDKSNIGIAYTYNEPGIWYEFMMGIAKPAHAEGLKNVMVSNGFISEAPLNEMLEYFDAFNIDLKGFSREFYRKFTGTSLDPVLGTLKLLNKAGKHFEITCLVIPGQNDDPDTFTKMISWIENELGSRTVLHLSRYHPAYKLGIHPTSAPGMEKLLDIARKKLFYVYAGNINLKEYQDTTCCSCGRIVIKRTGYYVDIIGLNVHGNCNHCGNKVILC